MTHFQFRTAYMDVAVFDLAKVIRNAKRELKEVDFDTLVGTGFSSGIVIPALALALKKKFVLIRKETDDSHHGSGRMVGELGDRWIFLDDFVSSGRTKERVIQKVAEAVAAANGPVVWYPDRREWGPPSPAVETTYVGDYLYTYDPKSEWSPRDRFQPFDPTDRWYAQHNLFQANPKV